jgi:Family of unknown function (DUF6508)
MDISIIDECIEYLETMPNVNWHPSEKRKDGVLTMAYPIYDSRVTNLFKHLSESNFTDFEYLNHIDEVKGKSPDTLSLEECKTFLAFIMRGERFCDGHIGSFIEDGTLLDILYQFKKHLG